METKRIDSMKSKETPNSNPNAMNEKHFNNVIQFHSYDDARRRAITDNILKGTKSF